MDSYQVKQVSIKNRLTANGSSKHLKIGLKLRILAQRTKVAFPQDNRLKQKWLKQLRKCNIDEDPKIARPDVKETEIEDDVP